MLISSMTKKVGSSWGTVTFHIFWNRPAPSIVAASYSTGSMPVMDEM